MISIPSCLDEVNRDYSVFRESRKAWARKNEAIVRAVADLRTASISVKIAIKGIKYSDFSMEKQQREVDNMIEQTNWIASRTQHGNAKGAA